MMISPTSAGDLGTAAAGLDRQLRALPGGAASDSSPGASPPDGGPDVVVSFGQGASSPATYDASGRMPGAPTLEDLGANAPDSLAHASETVSNGPPPGTASASPDGNTDAPDANANTDPAAAGAA